MVKKKKATFPIWAVTLENVANKRPDKDQLNNNLSMVKNQPGTPGSLAASQRSRILIHLRVFNSLNTLQALRECDLLRLAARVKELKNAEYIIKNYWTNALAGEGHSHRVAKYVLLKSKQLSLWHWRGSKEGSIE